jgi:hypothetical protein
MRRRSKKKKRERKKMQRVMCVGGCKPFRIPHEEEADGCTGQHNGNPFQTCEVFHFPFLEEQKKKAKKKRTRTGKKEKKNDEKTRVAEKTSGAQKKEKPQKKNLSKEEVTRFLSLSHSFVSNVGGSSRRPVWQKAGEKNKKKRNTKRKTLKRKWKAVKVKVAADSLLYVNY